MDAFDAIRRDVLTNRRGVGRNVHHAPSRLLIARGAGGQRVQRPDGADHRIYHHGSAAGHPHRASKEPERVAVSQLDGTEGEQPALLELTA